MTKVPFTVSARTARLIGQENFANAEGAVIELVKNSYDADAKNSIIFFDNSSEKQEEHSIYIIDNGIGMTDQIITSFWMMIGTDNKESNFETDSGRVKTGAKGIGRFALDKLGAVSEMYTLPEKSSGGYYWKVNWNEFQQKGIPISSVMADLEERPGMDLKQQVLDFATSFVPLTELITTLDFTHGTLIKISSLRETWDEDEIKRLFGNLEILIPPKEQPVFSIHLFSKVSPTEFGSVSTANYDDYDYKFSAEYFADLEKNVKITIQRNELDVKLIENNFIDVFSMPQMKEPPFNFETFKEGLFSYNVALGDLIKGFAEIDKTNSLDKIGKFSFTFYFLKNTVSDDGSDAKRYPYKPINSAIRRAWLKKFGGIKIFRDDFRVRPYGEYGQDWLLLGERYAQSPAGPGQKLGSYRIRPNQIAGTINISRLSNISFQDKSGREGIQENDVFDVFKQIIIGLISQFEKDRNTIMYSFSELYKKKHKEAEDKRKAEELAKEILEKEGGKKTPDDQTTGAKGDEGSDAQHAGAPSQNEIDLARGLQAQKEEIREKDDEIRLLRSLSGVGLIVASFAHELRSIRSLLSSRTDDLRQILTSLLDERKVKALPNEENPYTLLNDMREQDIHIKHWLDYSLSALKRDRRTRTNMDISEYFQSFKGNWENALKRRRVSITIDDKLKSPINIRAFAVDFDTVFNNLLANSLDSFKRKKDSAPRLISITIQSLKEQVLIKFSDTGAGLSKDFKNPEDIFLPFETSKVDKKGEKIGTGMGMYLVRSIIDDYKGDIKILEKESGFSVGIYLPLRKQNNNGQ